jgi:peptide/nickel transport system substrate-binding protein
MSYLERRPEHRRRLVVVLAAVLTAVLAACSGGTTSNSSSSGGNKGRDLVVARDMDINSLDPARAYCDTCQIYLSAVYETLIGLAPDNKTLEPRLAKSWSSNPTATVYTFNLDPRAKFSDGTPVTSADVKFSWLRLKNVKGSGSYLAQDIKSIDTSKPQTVVVTLSRPSSEFLNETNASYMGIVNSTLAKQNGATDAANASTADKAERWFLTHSAGSGPYVLQKYSENAEIDFLRNAKYWGTPPTINRVVMKEVKDAISQSQQLTSGSVDVAMQIDPITATSVHGDGVVLKTIPSFNFVWVGMSPGVTKNTDVPLNDKIRQAIRYAVDYPALIRTLLRGSGAPQSSPIPNGFDGSTGLPAPAQDLTKARQLLAEAGKPDGFTVTAIYPGLNVYGVDFNTAMQLVQSNLARVKVKLKLQPVTFSVFLDHQAKGEIPMTMVYFAPDYRGSAQYVNFFGLVPGSFQSTVAAGSGTNKPLVNASEGATFERALASTDPAAREQLYHQLALDMIKDSIVFPLFSPNLVLAYRNDVQGVFYSACCNLELWKLSRK